MSDAAEVFETVIYLIILTFQATYFTLNAGNIDVWLITSSEWSQERCSFAIVLLGYA